jgi:hypothetical protein
MIRYSQRIWPTRHGQIFKTWIIQGMNISRLDSASLQLQRKSTGICIRRHYSTCIKPPLNPSRGGKNGSKRRKRNQTADQTTMGKRGIQPIHPRVTGKRSSKITVKHWLVFPRLRLTNTKQMRYPASAVDITAFIRWNVLFRRPLRGPN